MRKIFSFSLLYFLFAALSIFITTNINAQTLTEGFETGLPTSGSSTAQNYTLSSGVWTILKGASTSTSHSGSLGLKLSAGSASAPTYAIAPALNAVATVSFWAKGSSATTVTILKSVNGGAYTTVATQAITTTFTQYTINVNETGSNVRIELANATSQTLYIDDVTITYTSSTPTPTLTVTPTSEAFGNVTVNTTSAEKTYSISGSSLSPASGSITLTSPTGYQLTTTSGSGYASSLSVAYTGSTLAATTIYIIFNPTLVQSYTGNVTNAGGGATTQNITLTGTGIAPPTPALSVTPSSEAFGNVTVNTTSAEKIYSISGSNLSPASGSITLKAPAGYQLTTTSGSGYASSLSVAYAGSTLAATTIYVVFNPTAAQSYTGNITNAGGGATTQNVALSGTGIVPTPVLSITATSLSSFGNIATGSSSVASSYAVSGSNLTTDISVTAPTGFQVSTDNSTFSSSVTVAQSGGTVASTTIYARFSPTAASGSTTGTITNTSTGATTQNVSVSGNALAVQPITQGSISFGTVTSTSIVVNLPTIGNGTNRIVVAKSGSAVSTDPTDATSYTANATFGSGTQIGSGNYVVYSGTDSVTVTGLTASTTYYFAVYEYNVGTGTSQNYLTPSTVTGNQQTAQAVATPPSTLTEGFETGLPTNGPTSAQDYTLASGVWTLYKAASSTTEHSGSLALKLSGGSTSVPTYAIAPAVNAVSTVSFWAKGSGASTVTILKSVNGGAYTTVATQVITSSFAQYTINVNETGSNVRIEFANTTSQTLYIDDVTITGGVATPTATVTVSATSLASFGNLVTGNNSAASTYTVSGTNLTANISITAPTGFQISTDNSTFSNAVALTQSGGTVAATTIYARFSPTAASGSTTGTISNSSTGATTQNVSVSGTALAAQPTTQGTISFGTVTSTSIVVSLPTVGNGTNRIIVAKSGSAVSTDPTDGTSYSASTTFGSGTQIGSGNYVVYNGTGSSVTVTGLTVSTTYYFAVYEYNIGTGTSQNYLTPSTVTGNQATVAAVVAPAIAFDTVLTTHFINPPYVSGTISDPTDPASVNGIVVDITANGTGILAANYTLTAASSKTSVVPTANIIITKNDGTANIKIIPAAVGYANITLTMKSGSTTKTLVIDYAASAASATPSTTFWHTGYSDASAAIRLDSNYMVIGDDEFNYLFVSDRNHSGLPVKTFYFGDLVGLTDGSTGDYKEADLEACTPSVAFPGRSYWTGSMSNGGSSNKYEPDRNTLFATNISGTGAATSISVVGHYNNLLTQLVTWGDANGYDLSSSSEAGHDPKTIDGFNVEGMAIGPDNTTLYIGFRAPLVPTGNRTKALIAPILNFETWFNNGKPSGNPTIGAPIELNLGTRGIRDIVRLSNGDYIIVAGSYEGSNMIGALFKWTGNATDAPVQITNMDISSLNAEACVEMHQNGQLATNQLQIISDNGSFVFYGDGTEAKDLTQNNYEKYRSDIITATDNTIALREAPVATTQTTSNINVYPNPVTNGSFTIETTMQGIKQVKIMDDKGTVCKTLQFNNSTTTVSTAGWAKGNYELMVIGNNGAVQTQHIIVLR